MVFEEQVREQLKTVMDPELMINIVDLGLIYEIRIQKSKVYVKMTLTSPMCPLADTFEGLVTKAIKKLKGVANVEVELTFDPPWNEGMMSDEAKAELGMF